MIRETSISAYHEIRENGLLSKRRWEVYDALYRHGPSTANEIFVHLQKESRGSLNAASNSAARFSELREMGVVRESGEKFCTITGMTAIVWEVTDRLPLKLNKGTTKSLWIFFPRSHEEKIEYFKTKEKAVERKNESDGNLYEAFKG